MPIGQKPNNIHVEVYPLLTVKDTDSIKNTVNWNEQRMEISLIALIENFKSGDTEMRNFRADLEAVFRERLKVYGWTIGQDVEPMWSAKTTTWLLKGHRLCSKSLAVGSTATIEFIIVSPQIVWMSKDFILCSLSLHTPMPHLVSFTGVLSLCAPARIKSIVNISKRYADALSSSAERLVKDRADRIAFIDQYGLNMWRERRFLMYWEAALLDVGHVTRWIVELQK
ncbi:hypothetical protein IW262DRAFT_1480353 [Armillaria fumosa]|nr:hypothetical protein IW262DRAFT_1480353 [Armillaria fumosa]